MSGSELDIPTIDDVDVDLNEAFIQLAEDAKQRKKERMKLFGANLKSFRVKRRLTLAQACDVDHLCMCVNTLKSYENGVTEPGIEEIVKFSKFYNKTIDEIIGLNDKEIIYDYEPLCFDESRMEVIKKLFKITNYGDFDGAVAQYRDILKSYIKNEDDKYLVLRGKVKNKNFGIKKNQ